MAFIGIASPESASSATNVGRTYGADVPNGIDLEWVTYTLFGAKHTYSMAYVIGEDGKIESAFDLFYLATQLSGIVAGARDPYGIDTVPAACRETYRALKYGQYSLAAKAARTLMRSSDAGVKSFGEKVVAAVEKIEGDWIERMKALEAEGRAGELHEEAVAFAASFPTSTRKSTVSGYVSSAKNKGNGKKEALAAANFQRAVASFSTSRSTAMSVCEAIATQLAGTYHGAMAAILVQNINKE